MFLFKRLLSNKIFKRSLIAAACMVAAFSLFFMLYPKETVGCRQEDLMWQTVLPAAVMQDDDAQSSEKTVYLTFDDGPSKTTQRVLEILKQENVKATFFVISAPNNEEYWPLVSQIDADGHVIGLHSKTHVYDEIYASSEAFWQDIQALEADLAEKGIIGINLLRFPGGSSNTISRKYGGSEIMEILKTQASEKGYTYFDWTVDTADAVGQQSSASTIYERVVKQATGQDNCIVLMHDIIDTKTTADALPDIIKWFKNAGYTFDTLNNAQTPSNQ